MNNKNLNLFLLTLFIVGLFGCDKLKSYEQTESGLKYKIIEDKEGPTAKEGQVLSLLFTMKNSKDSIFNQKTDLNEPFPLPLRKPEKGSIEEGLLLLSKGDSATFFVKADSFFKQGQMPPFVEKGSDITFNIRLLNISTPEAYQKEQMEKFKKNREDSEKKLKEHVAIDDSLIRNYISKNNIQATKTASGLYYSIDKQGSGDKPAIGDTIQVEYRGYFLDGKEFDSSKGGQEFKFPIGAMAVIPGWDEGFLLLNKGTKAKLFIPSALGYQHMANGPIPPFSVLLFDVELVDIIKKKPESKKKK